MKETISQPRFTFNTVGLFTTNNKATVDFYTKAFGFTTSWDGVQPNVEMFLGNNRIILFPRDAFEQMVSKKFQYPEGFNGTMELYKVHKVSAPLCTINFLLDLPADG